MGVIILIFRDLRLICYAWYYSCFVGFSFIAEILTKWIEVLKSLLENQKDDINYCTAATISVILKILKEHASWGNDFMDFTPPKIK